MRNRRENQPEVVAIGFLVGEVDITALEDDTSLECALGEVDAVELFGARDPDTDATGRRIHLPRQGRVELIVQGAPLAL